MKTLTIIMCLAAIITGTAFAQSGSTQAEPKVRIYKDRLPKGVSQAKAAQLMRMAAAGRTADSLEDETFASDLDAFSKSIGPETAKIKSYIEQESFYQGLVTELKKIGQSSQPFTQKQAAIQALLARYRPQIDAAVKRSGVSNQAIVQKARTFFRDQTTTIILPDMQSEILGNLSRFFPEGPAPAPADTFSLFAPYAFDEVQEDVKGACIDQHATTTADASTGDVNARAESSCFLLGSRPKAVATVGTFINVPQGVKEVEVTATVQVSFYKAEGYTEFGFTTVTSSATMTVNGNFLNAVGGGVNRPNNLNERKVKETLASITTAVPFVTKKESGSRQLQLKLKFSVPGGTEEQYAIRLSTKGIVFSESVSISDAITNARCSRIHVRFIR